MMMPIPIEEVKRMAGRFCPCCALVFDDGNRIQNIRDLLAHMNDRHLEEWKEILSMVFDFSGYEE